MLTRVTFDLADLALSVPMILSDKRQGGIPKQGVHHDLTPDRHVFCSAVFVISCAVACWNVQTQESVLKFKFFIFLTAAVQWCLLQTQKMPVKQTLLNTTRMTILKSKNSECFWKAWLRSPSKNDLLSVKLFSAVHWIEMCFHLCHCRMYQDKLASLKRQLQQLQEGQLPFSYLIWISYIAQKCTYKTFMVVVLGRWVMQTAAVEVFECSQCFCSADPTDTSYHTTHQFDDTALRVCYSIICVTSISYADIDLKCDN